ncbi:MAG: DNA polymerase III subunit chi [Alphaproteobacteria bacterium]|nr:DNA polymerase III subunit chi [Alphaproteobacteria bacterium]
MSRIDFYHLQKGNIEETLPKLLEKAYATGKQILIKIGTDERVEFLNSHLWTYDEQSFLPHGSKKDGNSNLQPIWLTSQDDNPNNAEILFLVDNAKINADIVSSFERVLNIFDGNNQEALNWSREFWKQLKSQDMDCFYWQQDENGSWKQKA